MIGKTEASLLGDVSNIEFIIFDKSKGRQAYRDIRRVMKDRKFDVALCMHASMRANRLCRLVPAPIRLGFDFKRARDFQWLFTNKRIAAAPCEHALDAMMGFARFIGAKPTPLRWDIPIGDADRTYGTNYCGYRALVISPCSSQRSHNFRNWPIDRFAQVAKHAQTEHGCRIVLTGGSSDLEHEYGQEIDAQIGKDVVNLIGKTTLKQSLAVFAAADLLLCPDSGPAHMATAVGTPVVGLYATSNPLRTGPYISRQLTVNRYPDALQKFLGKTIDQVRWGQRVRNPDAMNLIRVTDVVEKIDDVFGAN